MLTIAVTGPRPKTLWGYAAWAAGRYGRLQGILEQEMAHQAASSADGVRVRTGGAQGTDMLAHQAAVALKARIPVTAEMVLPYEGYDARWPETGLFSKEQLRGCIASADSVETVSALPSDADYSQVCTALHRRNSELVRGADLLIAVARIRDGAPCPSRGTASAVKRALSEGVPVLWVDPEKGAWGRTEPDVPF